MFLLLAACTHGAVAQVLPVAAQDPAREPSGPGQTAPGAIHDSPGVRPLMTLHTSGGLVTSIEQLMTSSRKGRYAGLPSGARHVGQTPRWDLYSSVSKTDDGPGLDIWHVPRPVAAGAGVARPNRDSSRQPAIRSRLSLSSPALQQSLQPRWWPALSNAWASQSQEGRRRISTMMGWRSGSLSTTSRFMHLAVQRGGLTPVRRVPVAGNAQTGASELLVFAAPGAELVMTLVAEPGRVGVVAHWIQMNARTP